MKDLMCRRLVLLSAALAALSGCGRDEPEALSGEVTATEVEAMSALDHGLTLIDRDGIEQHLRYLADDALKGRMTGSPEYDQAAAYVAEHFAQIGLQQGGDEGWYQQVPMLAAELDVESARVVYHQDGEENEQAWQEDFVMQGDVAREETTITAEVVFVGFGVHAPEMDYSDYEGIDVEGKIVALFTGAPPTFPHNERAYYSSTLTKAEEAVARGAVGTIASRSRVSQQRMSWERITQAATGNRGMAWINLSGQAENYFPELQGGALVNVPSAEQLFSRSPITFEDALDAADEGRPLSTPLGTSVTLERKTDHETITSPNVIGILRGSDPALSSEFVVFSAHLDHIGVGAEVDGDDIYNGMYDNAMGVALLIETARAFAAMPEKPKRSILFVAVTGEERGLVGSEYFANYPTVPTNSMVANVNLDMPLFLYPLGDVIAFGAEHSSLEDVIAEAVAEEDFDLSPDPVPQEVLFIRSDQYSFVKQGVPSVFLVAGYNSQDPEINGGALAMAHIQTHYHRPSDDLSRPIHWNSALRFARANVRIGHAVAEADERPTWNEGDFFGEKFGRGD